MPEPTVEQLMTQDPAAIHKPSLVMPLIVFFLIPPVGVAMLWKEKSFHSVYAILSIILGGLNLLSALSMLVFVAFSADNLLATLQLSLPKPSLWPLILVMLLSLIQMLVSVYFYILAKRNGSLTSLSLWTLTFFSVVLDYVIFPIIYGVLLFGFVAPIYQHQLDQYKDFPPVN